GTQKSPKLAFRAGKGCLCLLHTLPKIAKSVKLLFQHFETMPLRVFVPWWLNGYEVFNAR
ncbi:MAG: hypothetical protein AB1797_09145, partial [bacterium]